VTPSRRPDVFISYAHEDRPYAELVRGYLLGRNHSVLSEEEDLQPGADWDEAITHSLEASGTVILILSPAFMSSKWCLYEAGIALAKQQRNEGLVIPIIVGAVDLAGLPASLRRLRLVDGRFRDEACLLREVDEMLTGSHDDTIAEERRAVDGVVTVRHD